jgi:hypothetical protein
MCNKFLALAGLALLLVPSRAAALDRFEIQVYQADIDAPGQAGLEIHTNYTFRGETASAYPGEIPADRAGHLTFEPSFGVAEWLELGGYVQFLAAPGEGARFGGVKLRAKSVIPPRLAAPWFFGLNAEIGRVPHAVEEAGWANEFRPILGYDDGVLLADVNPIFGYALSGPDKLRPELEPAAKLAVNTQRGFALGAEYYAAVGDNEQLAFVVFDLVPPKGEAPPDPWELDVGFGHGFTDATPQQWIAKMIIGKGF